MLESQENKDQLDFVYELFCQTQADELNYVYRGAFTQNITDNILALAEIGLDKAGESQKIKRRVYLIMVEGLQNITKHQDSKTQAFDKSGFFHILKKGSTFFITTANLIQNEKREVLTSHLERINNLEKEDLKKFYKQVLTKGEISSKGGAGLGLIEIARKSGRKLSYDFKSFNDEFCFFYLHTEVGTISDDEIDNEGFALPDIIRLHEKLNQLDIFLIFNSLFNQESLIYLLSIIERQIVDTVLSKKKVYNVIVEMLQNIIHHGAEIENREIEGKPGIFFISEDANCFFLSAGNYVLNDHVGKLKHRIKIVNELDIDELEDYYNKRLFNLEIDNSKETGLGIIDIRLKTLRKINYNLLQVDDKFSFFTLQTSVLKN